MKTDHPKEKSEYTRALHNYLNDKLPQDVRDANFRILKAIAKKMRKIDPILIIVTTQSAAKGLRVAPRMSDKDLADGK